MLCHYAELNNVLYLLYKTKVDTFSSEPLLNFIVVEILRIKLLFNSVFFPQSSQKQMHFLTFCIRFSFSWFLHPKSDQMV